MNKLLTPLQINALLWTRKALRMCVVGMMLCKEPFYRYTAAECAIMGTEEGLSYYSWVWEV